MLILVVHINAAQRAVTTNYYEVICGRSLRKYTINLDVSQK